MKITEAVSTQCDKCGARHHVSDEEYGCDVCRKPINRDGQTRQHLSANVFHNGEVTTRLEFCSWKCCIQGLRKVKTDYFVALPYLHYDEKQKGIRAKDFFAEMCKP
jgi:hypothetical protein